MDDAVIRARQMLGWPDVPREALPDLALRDLREIQTAVAVLMAELLAHRADPAAAALTAIDIGARAIRVAQIAELARRDGPSSHQDNGRDR
jgi:hypothetical protein